jgi:uncharacterized protein (DUF433 family)
VGEISNWRPFMPLDHQRFIERKPQVCGGEPVIKGTRVTARTIASAAASAEEDLPVPALPAL